MKSLFFALFLLFVGCKEALVHDLKEAEANRLIARLHMVSIAAHKERQSDGNWSIAVKSAEVVRALQFLNGSKIIRESSASPDDGSSILASREQRQMLLERSLSTELERTIASIHGVLDARVHLKLPPASGTLLSSQMARGEGTASVLVLRVPGMEISSEDISALVAGASGVSVKAVSVMQSDVSEESWKVMAALPVQNDVPTSSAKDHMRSEGSIVPRWQIDPRVLYLAIGSAVVLAGLTGILILRHMQPTVGV